MSQKSHRRRNASAPRFRARSELVAVPGHKIWPASDAHDAITWWQQRLEKPLFVYFIQDEHGAVKIGKAHDPSARLAELQCGNPLPLKIRAVVLAAANTERRLHRLWSGYCIRGEWFGEGAHLVELAKRTQRAQIDAFRRGQAHVDIVAMPADRITPDTPVAARVVFGL